MRALLIQINIWGIGKIENPHTGSSATFEKKNMKRVTRTMTTTTTKTITKTMNRIQDLLNSEDSQSAVEQLQLLLGLNPPCPQLYHKHFNVLANDVWLIVRCYTLSYYVLTHYILCRMFLEINACSKQQWATLLVGCPQKLGTRVVIIITGARISPRSP